MISTLLQDPKVQSTLKSFYNSNNTKEKLEVVKFFVRVNDQLYDIETDRYTNTLSINETPSNQIPSNQITRTLLNIRYRDEFIYMMYIQIKSNSNSYKKLIVSFSNDYSYVYCYNNIIAIGKQPYSPADELAFTISLHEKFNPNYSIDIFKEQLEIYVQVMKIMLGDEYV